MCVSKKSSKKGSCADVTIKLSPPPMVPLPSSLVSSRCSSIFCAVPAITVYLKAQEDQGKSPKLHPSHLKCDENICLLGVLIFSKIKTSLPCSFNRTVFASTSLNIRLKFSLSTRKK
jgi:hypothetical protein